MAYREGRSPSEWAWGGGEGLTWTWEEGAGLTWTWGGRGGANLDMGYNIGS